MKTQTIEFSSIVETVYGLPLEEREELKSLLEHNIADSRRDEILLNFKKTQKASKRINSNKLKFSSNISELKKGL